MQTEALLEMANERLSGPLKAVDDLDRDRKEVACGFRDDDKVYVSRITWKKVKYGGKEHYAFELTVHSLDPQVKVKMRVPRVSDGKMTTLSVPAQVLEATRNFKQEISG